MGGMPNRLLTAWLIYTVVIGTTRDCAPEFICFALLCGHLVEMGGVASDWSFDRI